MWSVGWRGKEWKLHMPEETLSAQCSLGEQTVEAESNSEIFRSQEFVVEGEGTKGIQDNSYGFGLGNSTGVGATYQDGEGTLRNQAFRWIVVLQVLQEHHLGRFQKGTKVTGRQSMGVLQS